MIKNRETIEQVIIEEKDKFVKTLANGEKEFKKAIERLENKESGERIIPGEVVFKLYDTYGFPPEVTAETCKRKWI